MDDAAKPFTYFSKLSWANNPTNRTGRFSKNEKISIAGEIERKAKIVEKTNPGPCRYDNHQAKLKNLPKVKGNYTFKQSRVTFMEEAIRLEKDEHFDCGKLTKIADPVSTLIPILIIL
jgi:hypothetical protein